VRNNNKREKAKGAHLKKLDQTLWLEREREREREREEREKKNSSSFLPHPPTIR
jgi:hypothetical protein